MNRNRPFMVRRNWQMMVYFNNCIEYIKTKKPYESFPTMFSALQYGEQYLDERVETLDFVEWIYRTDKTPASEFFHQGRTYKMDPRFNNEEITICEQIIIKVRYNKLTYRISKGLKHEHVNTYSFLSL